MVRRQAEGLETLYCTAVCITISLVARARPSPATMALAWFAIILPVLATSRNLPPLDVIPAKWATNWVTSVASTTTTITPCP